MKKMGGLRGRKKALAGLQDGELGLRDSGWIVWRVIDHGMSHSPIVRRWANLGEKKEHASSSTS